MRTNYTKRTLALLLTLVLLALTACGGGTSTVEGGGDSDVTGGPSDGGNVLTIGIPNDLQSFDPANNDSASSQAIMNSMCSYLFRMDAETNVIGDLCVDYEIVDDNTWSFTIRDDATFWNGDKVTAEDVKFSLERPALDTSLRENQYFNAISGVDVVDEYTVHVKTHEPYPAMTMLLCKAGSEIIPKGYIEENGLEHFLREPIFSGPYEFVQWDRASQIVMKPYAGYYEGAETEWDQVVFRVIPENATRVNELLTGAIDICTDVQPNEWDRINANTDGVGTTVVSGPTTRVYMLMLRMEGDYATTDPRVREAIDLAINKEVICEQILKGAGHATRTRVPKGIVGHDESLDYTQVYDPDRARELLADAGYPDGLTMKMVASQGRYLMDSDIAQTIYAMLAEVGITIDLELLEFTTYSEILAAKTGPEITMVAYGSGFFDGSYPLNLFTKETAEGQMDYNSDRFDELFYDARSGMDLDKRVEQFKECQQMVAEDRPAISMIQIDATAGISNRVTYTPRLDEVYYIPDIHLA